MPRSEDDYSMRDAGGRLLSAHANKKLDSTTVRF
jgi:hypothetical protein